MKRIIVLFVTLIFPLTAYADHFETSLKRCEPIRSEIEKILMDEGVSKDYFFLALAESGCRTEARSKKGAVGLWQLSKYTARTYGLAVNDELDERLDWARSTYAAARYIKHLEENFNGLRWVVAAYNAGGSNLKRKLKFKNNDFLAVREVSRSSYNLAITVENWIKRDK